VHWAPGIPRALLFSRVIASKTRADSRRGNAESCSPIVMRRLMRGRRAEASAKAASRATTTE
jgi:hypothetical protein